MCGELPESADKPGTRVPWLRGTGWRIRGRARRAISQLPAGLLDFLSCEVGLLLPLPLTEHLYAKHFHEC